MILLLVKAQLAGTSQIGKPEGGALDLQLLAPKFELPLENLTWRVAMSGKWDVKHQDGSFQFVREEAAPAP